MSEVWKVVGYNLGIMLLYAILMNVAIFLFSADELGVGIYMMLAMALHVAICVFAAVAFYIARKPHIGSGFLLSALFLTLIGFSVCLGTVFVADKTIH